MIVIENADWEQFKKEIAFEIRHAISNASSKQDEVQWLTQRKAAKLLNVSIGTLNSYKRQGLPFSKVGRKVMFRKKDLLDFLESKSNRIPN